MQCFSYEQKIISNGSFRNIAPNAMSFLLPHDINKTTTDCLNLSEC